MINSILNGVKKEAVPPKKLQQKKQRVSKIACDLVGECIEKYPQVVGFELGGSYAKGTWAVSYTHLTLPTILLV